MSTLDQKLIRKILSTPTSAYMTREISLEICYVLNFQLHSFQNEVRAATLLSVITTSIFGKNAQVRARRMYVIVRMLVVRSRLFLHAFGSLLSL